MGLFVFICFLVPILYEGRPHHPVLPNQHSFQHIVFNNDDFFELQLSPKVIQTGNYHSNLLILFALTLTSYIGEVPHHFHYGALFQLLLVFLVQVNKDIIQSKFGLINWDISLRKILVEETLAYIHQVILVIHQKKWSSLHINGMNQIGYNLLDWSQDSDEKQA